MPPPIFFLPFFPKSTYWTKSLMIKLDFRPNLNINLALSNVSFWTKNFCWAGTKLYSLMPGQLQKMTISNIALGQNTFRYAVLNIYTSWSQSQIKKNWFLRKKIQSFLSDKTNLGKYTTLYQRMNYSTWNFNLNPSSTWNSNLSFVFNLEFQFQWG